jgi:hypothetical protein
MSHKNRQREARSGLSLLSNDGGGWVRVVNSCLLCGLSPPFHKEPVLSLSKERLGGISFNSFAVMIIEIQNRNYSQRNRGWKAHFNVSD